MSIERHKITSLTAQIGFVDKFLPLYGISGLTDYYNGVDIASKIDLTEINHKLPLLPKESSQT